MSRQKRLQRLAPPAAAWAACPLPRDKSGRPRRRRTSSAVRSFARAWLPTRNDACPTAQPQRCADRRPLSLSRTRRRRYGIARALSDDQRRFRHVPAERRLHAEPPRHNPRIGEGKGPSITNRTAPSPARRRPAGLTAQILDLVRGRRPRRVAGLPRPSR